MVNLIMPLNQIMLFVNSRDKLLYPRMTCMPTLTIPRLCPPVNSLPENCLQCRKMNNVPPLYYSKETSQEEITFKPLYKQFLLRRAPLLPGYMSPPLLLGLCALYHSVTGIAELNVCFSRQSTNPTPERGRPDSAIILSPGSTTCL